MPAKIADRLKDPAAMNQRAAAEFCLLSRLRGQGGQIKPRLDLGAVTGDWAEPAACVNGLIHDRMQPTREMARVIGAVARGDLSQPMPLEIEGRTLKGEFRQTAR